MAPLQGSASYKKKAGTLAMSSDNQTVSWTASGSSAADLAVAVSSITNLQQTPATAAKVMLKIFEKPSGSLEALAHTFQFASDDRGRAEASSIRDALSAAIAAAPKSGPGGAAPKASDGQSAAMAIAAATSAVLNGSGSEFDDERLLADSKLQQKLLAANRQLASVFTGAAKQKPDSIPGPAFQRQFWSSRIRQLRAFAVEQSQSKADYNILAALKPKQDEAGNPVVKIVPEQMKLILTQYPIVRKAKADLSKLKESEFWIRFFRSRLYKKLRGHKISDEDHRDDLFDRYLTLPNEEQEREQLLAAAHVPHTIDLGGNMQDNSQRQGNAPDLLNRPSAVERVPVMRAVNSLSERLLSKVAPSDVDPSDPIGVDEATFNEMALKDLADATEARRMVLNINGSAKLLSTGRRNDESVSARLYARQDPQEVLRALLSGSSKAKGAPLAEVIGVDDSDSDEDMEDDGQGRPTHVGSRSSRRQASKQVFSLIRELQGRANESMATSEEEEIAAKLSLSIDTYRDACLTQAAATVFLGHFWSLFHSGDASKALELEGVAAALDASIAKVNDLGEAAEKEREQKVKETRNLLVEHYKRTGRRQTFDPSSIKGGRKVVNELMASIVQSLRHAGDTYLKAIEVARSLEAKGE